MAEQLPPEEPGPPPDPGPPPNMGDRAPEAANAPAARHDKLAPNTNDTQTCAPMDDGAMTTVSPEAQAPSTKEGGEQGAASAPAVPNIVPTHRHHDECVKHAETELGETMGHSMGSQPTKGPNTPGRDHTKPERSATAEANVQVAPFTAADFEEKMTAIMAAFSKNLSETISATLRMSVEDNRNTSRESAKLIHDQIRSMSETSRAEATSSHSSLHADLRELTRAITDAMHMSTVQGAAVQTLIDSLNNRSFVQTGANPNTFSSSRATPTDNLSKWEDPPRIPTADKGKHKAEGPQSEWRICAF